MFNKELKQEIKAVKNTVEELMTEIASLKEDYKDYLEWRKMRDANAEAATKQGHFFLNSKADVNLLEQVISEINRNEDLCALFTTSDGATLSLRVHKQPNNNNTSFMNLIGKYEEE